MILSINQFFRLGLRIHERQLVQNPAICPPMRDSFLILHSLCDPALCRLAVLTVLVAFSTSVLAANNKLLRTDKADEGARRTVQSDKDTRRIKRGKSVKRVIAGDEAHHYQLRLEAGDYTYVTVEQRSIDVAVTLIAPNSEQLFKIDQSWIAGTETLHWIAKTAGSYELKVSPSLKQSPSGEYKLKVRKKREATAQDKIRADAEMAFNEIAQPAEQLTVELERKALERYHRASQLWRSTGDRLEEATALNDIGKTFYDLGEIQKSLDPYSQALAIWRAIKERSGEAVALEGIGRVHYYMGELDKSLDFYNRALAIWRDLKDTRGEGLITDNIGTVYHKMSDFDQGIEFFNRALSLKRAAGDVSGQAQTLNNLAVEYQVTGKVEKALDTYNESLGLSRATGNRSLEAQTLLNVGRIYEALGQRDKALQYLTQALDLTRAYGPRTIEGEALNHIGAFYYYSQDKPKALEYYTKALELRRGDREGEATTLSNIGVIHRDLKEYDKALDCFNQTLSSDRASRNLRRQGEVLNNIARTYDLMGDKKKARDNFDQALALNRAVGDRMTQGNTLFRIARLERGSNNLDEARKKIEEAITTVESLRNSIVNRDLRTSYFSTVQQYYQFYIDLLMQMHQRNPSTGLNGVALQMAERSRARGLIELLTEAGLNIRQGVDAALVERLRSLQNSLSEKANKRVSLMSLSDTQQQIDALDKEVDTLNAESEQLEARIRATSPRYTSLVLPKPLTATELQEVLDPETILLEYFLANERSYMWAVTPSSIASYELPKRSEIEDAARKFYDLLNEPNQQSRTAASRGLRVVKADANNQDVAKLSVQLGRLLLGPVAKETAGKRLAIVADGALQYLPFAALMDPLLPEGQQQPLMLSHEIVSLPSASSLAALRSEIAGRAPAPKTLAVLADPVFDLTDERVKGIISNDTSVTSAEERALKVKIAKAAKDVGLAAEGSAFPRLLGTRDEAEKILSLIPEGQKKRALDFEADRATATSEELSQYRFVHFATHGFMDSKQPAISGLLLSRVNQQRTWQNGFLSAPEIYNLKLPAELVVLSACQTGLGKEVKGEGLIGLTRGFMYAGAARVVVSLWSVDDQATAELMVRFYKGMLQQKLTPAAALRSAQIEMWRDKRWQAPYYWSAFVLQGEWK